MKSSLVSETMFSFSWYNGIDDDENDFQVKNYTNLYPSRLALKQPFKLGI